MVNEKIHIRVDRPKRVFLRIFIQACLIMFVGILLILFSIEFDFKNFPWSIAAINFIVVAFILPIIVYFGTHNFHILELVADEDILQVKYLDKRVEKQATIPLKNLIMVLGGTGTRDFSSIALTIFNGNQKIVTQAEGNGWTKQMFRDVYGALWKYNPKNIPPRN